MDGASAAAPQIQEAEQRIAHVPLVLNRRSFNWRYEVLYMWTRSRDTIEEGFSTTENIIDVRVKRLF